MSSPAIETVGLVKTFGHKRALDGLDLRVEPGQVHGFLGPNGAGKSTTIRILLGLLRADSGSVRLLGGDPWSQAPALHRRLAYVPGDVNLWPNLTGGEAIDLLARVRGGIDEDRRAQLIDRFEFDPHVKGRAYSKGNRQKVALIAAFAADAELYLFDEPTSGLDPLMERVFTDLVRERRDQGATVLLSSHILSEVEALCDHVSILRAGRVVETGTLSQLRHLTATRISVTAPDARHLSTTLAALADVHDVQVEGDRLTAQASSAALPEVLEAVGRSAPTAFSATAPTLEEVFLQHYDTRGELGPR